MTEMSSNPTDDGLPGVRPELAGDLTALYRRDIAVPARVDNAIREAARRAVRRCPSRARWFAGIAAAALVAVSVWALRPGSGGLAGDVDGDGRVDIVDAFVLARRVESGTGIEGRFDITGDGVVDSRDVESIAASAVSLTPKAK